MIISSSLNWKPFPNVCFPVCVVDQGLTQNILKSRWCLALWNALAASSYSKSFSSSYPPLLERRSTLVGNIALLSKLWMWNEDDHHRKRNRKWQRSSSWAGQGKQGSRVSKKEALLWTVQGREGDVEFGNVFTDASTPVLPISSKMLSTTLWPLCGWGAGEPEGDERQQGREFSLIGSGEGGGSLGRPSAKSASYHCI